MIDTMNPPAGRDDVVEMVDALVRSFEHAPVPTSLDVLGALVGARLEVARLRALVVELGGADRLAEIGGGA